MKGWRTLHQSEEGFTLVELLVAMALIGALMSLTFVNLNQPQRTASVAGAVETLAADLRSQQLKAMAGDGVSSSTAQAQGVYIQPTSYTLYKGSSYSAGDTDNIVLTPKGVTLSTTF